MSGSIRSVAGDAAAATGAVGPRVLSTRVELSMKAKGLRNADLLSLSDPICVLWVKETEEQNYREHGRTEMIKDNLNPQWVHKFEVEYFFEEKQYLRFELYDIDKDSPNLKHHDALGSAECFLADVVANMTYTLELQSLRGAKAKGEIEVSAEELSTCKEVATLQWKASGLEKSGLKKPKVWFEISKEMHNESWTPVYRSESQSGTTVEWERFTVHVVNLCNGENDRRLRVQVRDENNKNRLVGEFETKWRDLSRGRVFSNAYQLFNSDTRKKKGDKYSHSGTMELVYHSSKHENTFFEYIHGGMQIEVTVAIDFTRSNGNPQDAGSLHCVTSDTPNPYARAIEAVVTILEHYDTDKMIPAYGFGALVNPRDQQASMMFPLNGSEEDAACFRVAGVMDAYHSALQRVTLHGPTHFAPIVEHVTSETSRTLDGSTYGVLLILTDGVIDDMPKTIKAVIKASKLPLSIIIIGVGDANFKAMEKLDSDYELLSFKGEKAERDIVQFVAFRDFDRKQTSSRDQDATREATTLKQLANEVLRELPEQILGYMKPNHIHPKHRGSVVVR